MKKFSFIPLICTLLFLSSFSRLQSQTETDPVKLEIIQAITKWNETGKKADVNEFVSLFDDSKDVLLVGSDSGEVYKGKEQMKAWLGMLFSYGSFTWEMNTIHIDYNGNTAWVFADGCMVVTSKKGKVRKPPYRYTGILVKKNNEWKWRLFNGSNPRPE